MPRELGHPIDPNRPVPERVVLVTRKTRIESLVERFGTIGQAKFYVQHAGANFSDYEREHATYHRSLEIVRRGIDSLLPAHVIERGYLPTYLFTEKDLVIAVGQDGLVVNVAKYLAGQPIIGVNPDPERFDGVLLPYAPVAAREAVDAVLRRKAFVCSITMAEALIGDGQRVLAFNDLFLGAGTHVSARYRLRFGGREEVHSSSGMIVSTGAGSTGWLSSLYNMTTGLGPLVLGEPGTAAASSRFDWEEERLRFVVREPFRSRASQAEIVTGEITRKDELFVESRMPEDGVIFSDGIESDFVRFNSGTVATVRVADQKTYLAVPRVARRG